MTPVRSRRVGPVGRGPTAGVTGPSSRAGRGGAAERRWRLVRADRDAVPPSVRRFMQRARRRRLRALLPWAIVSGGLALVGVGVWLVYGTALFGIREVRVTGGELLTPAEIRAAAGVPDGISLARVDVDAVRDRVAALPPVARVTVTRDWPHTLHIQVVERRPEAVVPQSGRYAVIDATGVVFQTVSKRPADLPVLRVATPGPEDSATRAGLEVLAALTTELRGQLVEIEVAGPARITVKLRGGRSVVWGDSSDNETKARVATALLPQPGKTIDVSAPDVVTIR